MENVCLGFISCSCMFIPCTHKQCVNF